MDVFLKDMKFGCLFRRFWENWISDTQAVPHWIPSIYCCKDTNIFVKAVGGVLHACLSEPPKVAQTSLTPQLMPLLPGWVFVYWGPASLLKARNMSQVWLVPRFRLPWKNWLEGREEKFGKLLSSSCSINPCETRLRCFCSFFQN